MRIIPTVKIIPMDARKARDEAMDRVEAHADEDWKAMAMQAVQELARYPAPFTTDAVWALLRHWEVTPPHEPRAMGPIMMKAVRLGLIVPTGEYKQSTSVVNHARNLRVYHPNMMQA